MEDIFHCDCQVFHSGTQEIVGEVNGVKNRRGVLPFQRQLHT
jgi:hypothetical protein